MTRLGGLIGAEPRKYRNYAGFSGGGHYVYYIMAKNELIIPAAFQAESSPPHYPAADSARPHSRTHSAPLSRRPIPPARIPGHSFPPHYPAAESFPHIIEPRKYAVHVLPLFNINKKIMFFLFIFSLINQYAAVPIESRFRLTICL